MIPVADGQEIGSLEGKLLDVQEKLEKGLLWLYGEKPGASPGSQKWKEGQSRYEELLVQYRKIKLQVDGKRLPERLQSLYDVLLFCSPPLPLIDFLGARREELHPEIVVWMERWEAIRAGKPSPIDDLEGRV